MMIGKQTISGSAAVLGAMCMAALALSAPATGYAQLVQPGTDSIAAGGGERFTLDLSKQQNAAWASAANAPTHYFAEFLPAYFSRELEMAAPLPRGTQLEWVFTGSHGGITLTIDGSAIIYRQRYYDSLGLVPSGVLPARYPSTSWKEESVRLAAPARRLAIVSSGMEIIVKADNVEILRQDIVQDLNRHQLRAIVSKAQALRMARPRNSAIEAADDELSLTLHRPQPGVATITLHPENRHQTILGFGGIVSFPAYAQMSAEQQAQFVRKLHRDNLLVQREYPAGVRLKRDLGNFDQLGDAVPHYYGDNFPNGETSNFAFSRQIRAIGGMVMFEFWEFPDWIQDPDTRAVNIAEYVRAMVGYCREAKRRTGAAPEIVGVQNEIVQNAETWAAMVKALRHGLDAAGFEAVRIHMPDAPYLSGGIAAAEKLRSDPEAWRVIDYSATHLYEYQDDLGEPDAMDTRMRRWRAATAGKPFLATEIAINASRLQAVGSYRIAFANALLYHKLLTAMDAEMLAYCWLLLDVEQPAFADTRSLFSVDRQHSFPAVAGIQRRTFAAFSRRLPKGIVRIDARSSDTDLLVAAFSAPGIGETIILLNRSTAPKIVRISGSKTRFRTIERTSGYDDVRTVEVSNDPVLIGPGEILTFSTVPLRTEAANASR